MRYAIGVIRRTLLGRLLLPNQHLLAVQRLMGQPSVEFTLQRLLLPLLVLLLLALTRMMGQARAEFTLPRLLLCLLVLLGLLIGQLPNQLLLALPTPRDQPGVEITLQRRSQTRRGLQTQKRLGSPGRAGVKMFSRMLRNMPGIWHL